MLKWGLSLAALAACAGTAQAATPQWDGVWQGTIGTLPVRACFAAREDDPSLSMGSYYYMNKLRPIGLKKAEGAGVWTEGWGESSTGTWTVTNSGQNALGGTWRQGGKSLPIALTRVATKPADEGMCASDAYMAPRLRPVTVTTKPANKGGIAYTELTWHVGPAFPDVSIVGFALREAQPGDRAINAAVRLDPSRREGNSDYLSCSASQISMHGEDGSFAVQYSPEFANSEFISVAISEGGDCGGAHPFTSQTHLTFDRKTGRKVDLATWFTARAVPPRGREESGSIVKISPALRSLVMRHARIEDRECREAVAGEDYWDIALIRQSMAFTASLPHVAQACEEAIPVPFAALSAMLSPAGKAGVARAR